MLKSRKRMVFDIREKYGLKSPEVLSVMLRIPRHKFLNPKYTNIAYSDEPVPLGYGQTMSQPYTVAFMTDLLELTGTEKVLEIGTGSGYQAAVLSGLSAEVFSLEIVPGLAEKAAKTLKELNFENVHVKKGSGEWGWKDKAPFDRIIVTAALEGKVPGELFAQLKPGGLLVIPLGTKNVQTMTRFRKKENGKVIKEEFQKFVFVPFLRGKNN